MWYMKWTILSTIALQRQYLDLSPLPQTPSNIIEHHRTSHTIPPPFNTARLWFVNHPEVIKGQWVSAWSEIWDIEVSACPALVPRYLRVLIMSYLPRPFDASPLPVGCRWFIKRFALIALSVSGARERVRWFIERFALIALNDSWRRERVRPICILSIDEDIVKKYMKC